MSIKPVQPPQFDRGTSFYPVTPKSLETDPPQVENRVLNDNANKQSLLLEKQTTIFLEQGTQNLSPEKIKEKIDVFQERIKKLEVTERQNPHLQQARQLLEDHAGSTVIGAQLMRSHDRITSKEGSCSSISTQSTTSEPSKVRLAWNFLFPRRIDTAPAIIDFLEAGSLVQKKSNSLTSTSPVELGSEWDLVTDSDQPRTPGDMYISMVTYFNDPATANLSLEVIKNKLEEFEKERQKIENKLGYSQRIWFYIQEARAYISSREEGVRTDVSKKLDSLITLVKSNDPTLIKEAVDQLKSLTERIEIIIGDQAMHATIGALILFHLTMIHLNKGSIDFASLDPNYGMHAFANSDGCNASAEERMRSILRTQYDLLFDGLLLAIKENRPAVLGYVNDIKALNTVLSQCSDATPEMEQFNDCLNTNSVEGSLKKAYEVHRLIKQRWKL